MNLPLTRLAKLIGSFPRDAPDNYPDFKATTYPQLYNTLREILFLLKKLKIEAGEGISVVDDGKVITITNLNP